MSISSRLPSPVFVEAKGWPLARVADTPLMASAGWMVRAPSFATWRLVTNGTKSLPATNRRSVIIHAASVFISNTPR